MIRNHSVSPFPGMNPYLEGPVNWSDFHSTFIHAIREAINDQLPEPYYARVTELVMMVDPELPTRAKVEPDVLVGRDPFEASDPPARWTGGGAVGLLEPETMTNVVLLDPYTELQVEIIRLPDQEVVTVVELFSPTNKYGEGRGAYADKRNRLMHQAVNLFELDLIRAGPRLRLTRPLPPDHYFGFVSRADRRPECDVYHWSVRDSLPTLPVPLRSPDPDLMISLADPFRVAFARGRYGRFIDYAEPPPAPAFDADTAAWIRSAAAAGPTPDT